MDVSQLSSLFLSNFEDFINTSKLKELEKITGYTLIKDLGDDSDPKLQFLNQGVNSKELILFFLLKTMRDVKEHFSEYEGDVINEFSEIFKRFSHLRMKWSSDSDNMTVLTDTESGNKRQLSVKSRGTYYTPQFMSEFMCKDSIQAISQQKINVFKEFIQKIDTNSKVFQLDQLIELVTIRVIDLSMGIGNFLCNSIPYLKNHLLTIKDIMHKQLIPVLSKINTELVFKSIPFCSQLSRKEENEYLGNFIAQNCLYGIEIDPKIQSMANIIVSLKIKSLLGYHLDLYPHLICKNSIITEHNTVKDAEINNLINKLNGFIFAEQFPEVFSHSNGGFDIVIGNPPWEILKPNNREFFSNYRDDFIQLKRTKQDEFLSKMLKNKAIRSIFEKYSSNITSQTNLISSLGYSHQSSLIHGKCYTGDPQLFKFFLEIAFNVVKNEGIISLIVQHNFLGSKSCANLRKLFVNNGKLNGIWEFYNRSQEELYFQNVDPNQRFIIFQFKKQEMYRSDINYKKCISVKDLNRSFLPYHIVSPDFYFEVSSNELQLFGFVNKEHRSVFEKILRTQNDLSKLRWKNSEISVILSQDLHVTRDRKKFSRNTTSISIYGGRSFGPYYFQPRKERYLEENAHADVKILERSIICRNILPNSAKRIVFSIPPKNALVDNSCTRLCLENNDENVLLFILAVSNSLLVELYLRTILTGINLNYYLIQRIPIPSQITLSDEKYEKIILNVIETSKKLPHIPLETKEWARAYARIESALAILFNLTKTELEVILDGFNFNKLQNTTLCGYNPFQKLTKKLILYYFDFVYSLLT